eukprot:813151-Pleurochrysis_carterae.AAC.1
MACSGISQQSPTASARGLTTLGDSHSPIGCAAAGDRADATSAGGAPPLVLAALATALVQRAQASDILTWIHHRASAFC